jgi:DNA repair protein RadD
MIKLRDYQNACIDALFAYLKTTKGQENKNPLLQVPTGGGKSLIQAHAISKILEFLPTAGITCLCHSTEIIKQNYDEYVSYTRSSNAGIYCGKLNRKDRSQILFSSIQSAAKSDLKNRRTDIIFIDEAHLCNNSMAGQYRQFIDDVKKLNPDVRIIGMTATPWRMDGGCLLEGKEALFSSIAYRITIRELIDKGDLSTIVTPDSGSLINIDYSGLVMSPMRNDYTYDSLESAVMRSIDKIVPEFLNILKDRKHIMIFCPTVEVCNKIKSMLNAENESAELFIGSTSERDRNIIKRDFTSGKVRWLLTVDAGTTGFNVKNIDAIVGLRKTNSSSKWIQILGRGMRVYPGKKNCMLLDYGENISRHGAVEHIEAPPQKVKRGSVSGESAYIKNCPSCDSEMPMSCSSCPHCNYQYPIIERKFSKFEEGKDVLFDGSNKKPDAYNYKIESIIALPMPGHNDRFKLFIDTSKKKVALMFFIDREPSKSELVQFFEKGLFRVNENNKLEFSQKLELVGEIIKAISDKDILLVMAKINEYADELTPKYAAISYEKGFPEVKNFVYE